VDERIKQARLLYEQAVFTGETAPLAEADRQLDAAEADLNAPRADLTAAEADLAASQADLAVARGRILHTRFLLRRDEAPAAAEADPGELALFERAAQLYRELGDVGSESEALFWVGCFHQVAYRDNATALPVLERSLELASQAGDKTVMAEVLRHLGIEAHAAGRMDAARQRLEESTRLRREIGQLPGAAANLVGLAYIAAAQDRHDDALALLDEAAAIAVASNAHRILEQVNEARAALPAQPGRHPA
jgi:tetratricopeptide (TPR) repeat protein